MNNNSPTSQSWQCFQLQWIRNGGLSSTPSRKQVSLTIPPFPVWTFRMSIFPTTPSLWENKLHCFHHTMLQNSCYDNYNSSYHHSFFLLEDSTTLPPSWCHTTCSPHPTHFPRLLHLHGGLFPPPSSLVPPPPTPPSEFCFRSARICCVFPPHATPPAHLILHTPSTPRLQGSLLQPPSFLGPPPPPSV